MISKDYFKRGVKLSYLRILLQTLYFSTEAEMDYYLLLITFFCMVLSFLSVYLHHQELQNL